MKRSILYVTVASVLLLSTIGLFPQEETKNPISFRKLIKFLVDIEGFKAEKPKGQNIKMGNFKASEANRDYANDTVRFNVKIADYSHYPMMKKGFEMMGNFEVDSTEKLLKKVKMDGYTGIMEIEFERKRAKFIVILDNSVLVIIEGKDVEDKEDLMKFVNNFDIKAISLLK